MNPTVPESKLRTLVVDDERPIRRFLSAALGLEYTVLEAASGQEALTAVLSGRPDVIILDMKMPQVSGVDFLEFLRQRAEFKHLPVVVLSTEAAEVTVDRAMNAGADAYVTKPVALDELEQAIKKAQPSTPEFRAAVNSG